MEKAGICKTRNEKILNLKNPEWKKPESVKHGMRKSGL
jgi:hypothetical protein